MYLTTSYNHLFAVDAKTGKYICHLQYIPHDIWDMDAVSPAVLTPVADKAGKTIAGVLHAGKSGYLYVHDAKDCSLIRSTGLVEAKNERALPTKEGVLIRPGLNGGVSVTPLASVVINTTCSPTDLVTRRSIRLEAREAMSQKIVSKSIARGALLLFAGFAGASAAQAQATEQKAAVCKACHLSGTTQSRSVIPNIWGQSAGYIYIQLRDFKSGARNAPEDAAMRGFVAAMSDADMLEMAKYAWIQPWPKVEPISTDAALLKKGAYATALGGCVGCRFNDWKGFSANPRIGDQSSAYLALTFCQFRSGSRANSPGMSDLVRTLDEGDIEAVAAYLNAAQQSLALKRARVGTDPKWGYAMGGVSGTVSAGKWSLISPTSRLADLRRCRVWQ
jgi:cytochrome c553